jgi:hypothetical protein
MKTGQVSQKVFAQEPGVYFNSAVFRGRLYRLSREDGYRLDVFELQSGKNIYSKKLGRYATFYSQPFIIADTTASGSLVLTMGSEARKNTGVPILATFGLTGIIVSSITKAVIYGMDERLVYYAYNYLEGSVEEGFYPRNYVHGLLTPRVAKYESEAEAPMVYKGYINGYGFIFGIYRYKDSSTLRIVKFE